MNMPVEVPVIPWTQGKYPGYEVIHFPASGKYFPTYNGTFLCVNFETGIVSLTEYNTIGEATGFTVERSAWETIEKHIEQSTRNGVVYLKRPTYEEVPPIQGKEGTS